MPDDLEILLATIIDDIAFFESVEDEVLDPDVCVQKLEDIGASLRALSRRGRLAFVALAVRRAEEETDAERADFFRSLPQNLGLIEE